MDELIVFCALGSFVEDVTGRDITEILPAEVITKIDEYVDGATAPTAAESTDRLLAIFEQATDRLLTKIDEEAA